MKEYFYFHKKWSIKTHKKGRKGGYAFRHLLDLVVKKTMVPVNEGFVFIDLMFRKYTITHHRLEPVSEYEREKK